MTLPAHLQKKADELFKEHNTTNVYRRQGFEMGAEAMREEVKKKDAEIERLRTAIGLCSGSCNNATKALAKLKGEG
jgi:hypothetical protein